MPSRGRLASAFRAAEVGKAPRGDVGCRPCVDLLISALLATILVLDKTIVIELGAGRYVIMPAVAARMRLLFVDDCAVVRTLAKGARLAIRHAVIAA
jgi:hypothetical protein